MSFRPILPTTDAGLAELARAAEVAEGGARAALAEASSGAPAPPGELVVWAWTFEVSLRSTLLVDHPRFDELLPPGGRVEPGEDPRDAVLRELREETGLVGTLAHRQPALLDVVRGTTSDGSPSRRSGLRSP